jgi:hypothetical protein
VSALKEQSGQSTSTRVAGFFRRSLVTMQMAVSLLLLIAAALFGKTLVNLSSVDLGIQTDNLSTFSVNPRLNRYTSERIAQFYQQLTERLSAVPGVTLVTAARVPAVAGSSSSTAVVINALASEKPAEANVNYNEVGPGYFRTFGIPLVTGREFTDSDNAPEAPKVVIVNEAFVRKYFSGQNAVGRLIGRGGSSTTPDRTIVGVVKDAKYSSIKDPAPPVFYLPYRHSTTSAG